ncbi:MAG TPA: DUF4349 domain-containing protein [Jatrophihabitans sp.]|nr:DUF4349 domain-containing protein [Jatrophihabitans sp.]
MPATAALPSEPSTRPSRRLILSAVLAVLTILALAGCTRSGKHSQSNSAGGFDGAGPANGAAVAPSAEQPTTGSVKAPSAPLQQRAVVRTANMTVTVADVDQAADSALSATLADGGRFDQDNRNNDGLARHAELILRVPPAKLKSLMDTISRLGHEDNHSVLGEDVTASQADVNARVTALTISVGRLQDYLRHSGSITELVTLESQLTQRESELESTTAQQHALADQVDLASLTVELKSATRIAGSSPAGFGAALVQATHGLVLTLRWTAALLGYLLPFLVVLVVLVIPPTLWWRRRAVRVAPPEPASD